MLAALVHRARAGTVSIKTESIQKGNVMHSLPLESIIANRAVGDLARSARPDAPVRPLRRAARRRRS